LVKYLSIQDIFRFVCVPIYFRAEGKQKHKTAICSTGVVVVVIGDSKRDNISNRGEDEEGGYTYSPVGYSFFFIFFFLIELDQI
jgi:hypothetical protein